MLVRRYEMPWRRAYECYAGIGWLAAMVFFATVGATQQLPRPLALPLAVLCFAMGLLRVAQALRTLVLRASLCGRGIQVITTTELERWCRKPDQVFLGFGFEWRPVHSQRLYELAKIDYREFTVSPRLLTLLGYQSKPQPDAEIGLPYIHGVEPKEVALHRPLQNFEGGTLLVGTTQSGKGVALASLITQAVRRGDVVIVIDPKNSRRLKRVTQRACEDWRETDTFLEFHPAFPEAGVRLDFTFNWQKPTEIASRIQSIMPPDTAGAFSAFGWDAVNVVVQGLVELEERPNLVKLTKYIEGGIEPVLEGTLRRYYERLLGAGWRELPEMKKLLNDAHRGNIKRPSEAASADLLAFVAYYEHFVAQSQRNKVLDAQVRTFRHNREHYQKITANLLPVLSMLTSGDLGRSLSPEPFDADDTTADHELREDRACRSRSLHVPGFAARPVRGHRHRRAGAGRPSRTSGHALQPGRLPAHFAVRRRGLERHQPAVDRDPEQGRRGWHLHHLRHADPGRPGQAPGQRRRGAHGAGQPQQPDRPALEG